MDCISHNAIHWKPSHIIFRGYAVALLWRCGGRWKFARGPNILNVCAHLVKSHVIYAQFWALWKQQKIRLSKGRERSFSLQSDRAISFHFAIFGTRHAPHFPALGIRFCRILVSAPLTERDSGTQYNLHQKTRTRLFDIALSHVGMMEHLCTIF